MKMNKKSLVLGATFAITAQFGTIAMAASDTGTADVEIVQPITINESSSLNFGKIASGAAPGVINVDTGGTVTKTSGPAELQVVDPAGSAGIFAITGEGTQAFDVTVPATVVLSATGGSGGANMTVTLASDEATISPLVAGAATLTITGDLAVGTSQAVDTYSGSYVVTVFYQ